MYPSLPSSFLRLKIIFPSSLEINGFFSSFVTIIANVILKPFVSQIEWTHQLSTCSLKLPLGCKEDKNLLQSICKFGSNLRQNTDRECLQRTKISLQFSGWYTSSGSFFSLYHRILVWDLALNSCSYAGEPNAGTVWKCFSRDEHH